MIDPVNTAVNPQADSETDADPSAEADSTHASDSSGSSAGAVAHPQAASAGLLSGGVALGVGELLSGVSSRIPSLVARVGDVVIENVPGSIERWAIDTLGTNDKPALVIGIVVIALAVAAATGIAAARRFAFAPVVFGVFALVGALAAASDPQRPAWAGWFVAIVAAGCGLATLWWLLRAARAQQAAGASSGDETHDTRRRFVVAAGAAAAGAASAAVIGSALRGRQTGAVEADRDEVAVAIDQLEATTAEPTAVAADTAPDEAPTAEPEAPRELLDPNQASNFNDVDGITPIVVPNDDFYRIDTALVVPTIDVDTWSMKIVGMVDNEVEFSFDDLLAMDPVEHHVTLSCVSNEVGGGLVGNARWLGVPVTRLLDEAGVQPGATQIVGRSVDGWTGGFPTAYLDDPDRVALVAVAMNGEPLPVEHGFPARLVIAGLYGYVSATKWLKEIELTTLEDFDGYWIPRGWSKLGPIKTQSRIDVPRPNARIAAGRQAIAGVAWAPDRGVDQVEVRVSPIDQSGATADEGEWQVAELSADVTDNSWRQWHLAWQAEPGDYMVAVRATDNEGYTQTDERAPVAPDGATGWHTIAVRIE